MLLYFVRLTFLKSFRKIPTEVHQKQTQFMQQLLKNMNLLKNGKNIDAQKIKENILNRFFHSHRIVVNRSINEWVPTLDYLVNRSTLVFYNVSVH